jgi:hypothetical protein
VIIGHIVHHFQQVRNHHNYSNVIALDDELQQFVAHLPSHFAQDDPDTSFDASQPYIPVHRFIIITEVFFVRISLHRPYLLRRLSSDRYSLSRRACFDSAKRDYRNRQEFKRSASSSVLRALGGAYREFQAAMIAGIALMIDNADPEASEMHEILDGFIRDHEGIQDMDPTTKRELKIIEFFKRKAAAGSEDGTIADGGASAGYTDPMSALKDAQARSNSLVGMAQQFTASHHPPKSVAKRTAAFRGLALQQPIYQGTSTPTPSSPDQGFHSPYHGHRGGSGSVGSGFTPTDEAQQLLDVWCTSVINSGGMAPDAPAPTPDAQGQGWVAAAATPGMAGYAINFPPMEGMGDSTGTGAGAGTAPGYDADWTYWESLVSAINRNGAPA